MATSQFQKAMNNFRDDIVRRSKSIGPHYAGPNGSDAHAWYDQYFDREIEPAGIVNCQQALRVGATNNSLDVVLTASDTNETPILIPAASTIKLTFLQSDQEEGTFEPVGGSVCIEAPAGGMEIKPGRRVFRFPTGNFDKQWLMVNLEFTGAITGGKMDCHLGYMPR